MANEAEAKGNTTFSAGDYNDAIRHFTTSIELSPDNHVCLRWVYEQGVSVLVKSFNEERIRENLNIFGWMLSPEESEKINQIPQRKGYRGIEFLSDGGPFKTVEDLWDEEIDLHVTE
ncbi:hypothetical protein Vadar_015760 [Vaccinium darrowii]|uniref:Uncharacterized protein n=1 Tax=Vaccinium darrowii TaxID=229202 RepID=A0ACB7Y742_9ERIC|nr:hypothetical protein Vadar_015760 [Vaccinium darrowii]